jgi:glycosyltransferase involved in cell wall biosynthesis
VPEVTIGMPLYNNESTLAAALDSLLAQTIQDFRIVISDDGSSDATGSLCERYARSDPRITYIRQPKNLGYQNFRFVLDCADTPFFMWAAGDDRWAPTFIEENLRALKADASLAGSISKVRFERGGKLLHLSIGTYPLLASPVDNLAKFLSAPADNSRMYGVFRTEVLKRSIPSKSFHAYDWALSAATLLHGKHNELSEVLMFRDQTLPERYIDLVRKDHRALVARLFPVLQMTRWLIFEAKIPLTRRIAGALIQLNVHKHDWYCEKFHPHYFRASTKFRKALRAGLRHLLTPLLRLNHTRDGCDLQPRGSEESRTGYEVSPLVSIGIPVYNGERYLAVAIESVLEQTFSSFELLIADNASTDRTQEICRLYAKRDPRIRYFRHLTNRGAGFNYNFLYHQARGQYFKWLAHDDFIAPTNLAACVEALNADSTLVLAYTHHIDIDENGKPIRTVSRTKGESDQISVRFLDLMDSQYTCEEVFGLIRCSVLGKTPLIRDYADSDRTLLGELSLHGKFREVSQPLFFHRIHAESSVRRFPVSRERAAWFNPNLRGRLVLSAWRQFFHMLGAIARAPMGILDRLACYWQAIRWFKWRWRWMFKELFGELWDFFRRWSALTIGAKRASSPRKSK